MKNKLLHILLIVICAAVFAVALFFVVQYFVNNKESNEQFTTLSNELDVIEQEILADVGQAEVVNGETLVSARVLALRELREGNSDLVGWISIEGTTINYPVMQTEREPEYYLHRDFNKEKNNHGTPFLSAAADISKPSDNIIIYGHRMNDGSMFAPLLEYKEQEFYAKHRLVRFDTVEKTGTYEIIAVFEGYATPQTPDSFNYYQFVNAEDESEFDKYVDNVKELSFYETGIRAEYGDKLITLSTCEKGGGDKRIVVVAKEINKSTTE